MKSKQLLAAYLAIFAAASFLTAPTPADAGIVIDRIVAIVNDDVVTLTDLEEAVAERERLAGPETAASPDESRRRSLSREILNNMVEKSLQLQAARKKGIGVSSDEIKTALEDIKKKNKFRDDAALARALEAEGLSLPKYTDELRNRLTVLKMVDREVKAGIVIRDDETRAYYDAHPGVFALPEEIRLRQIFVSSPAGASPEALARARAKIDRVLAEIKGGKDFTQAAKDDSEGPEKAQGGEMGVFQPGELIPEIDVAIKSLKAGEMTGVIQSSTGFHILLVESRSRPMMSYDDVKKDIENILFQEKTEDNLRRWMLDLRAQAFVDIRL